MPRRRVSSPREGAEGGGVALDGLDLKILEMILAGKRAKDIASEYKKPLSTIQRRVRALYETGTVTSTAELNYSKLGLRRGEASVYLKDGDARTVAKQIASMEDVLSVSIHIGGSDIVALFVFKDSAHLLELTGKIRRLEGVDRVAWSEEVYRLPIKSRSLASVIRSTPGRG